MRRCLHWLEFLFQTTGTTCFQEDLKVTNLDCVNGRENISQRLSDCSWSRRSWIAHFTWSSSSLLARFSKKKIQTQTQRPFSSCGICLHRRHLEKDELKFNKLHTHNSNHLLRTLSRNMQTKGLFFIRLHECWVTILLSQRFRVPCFRRMKNESWSCIYIFFL